MYREMNVAISCYTNYQNYIVYYRNVKLLNRNLKTYSQNKNTKNDTNPFKYNSIISRYDNHELEDRINDLRFLKNA